jgi:hypothetical protein
MMIEKDGYSKGKFFYPFIISAYTDETDRTDKEIGISTWPQEGKA